MLVHLSHEDVGRIAALCERQGAIQAYAHGDLDPFFLPYTRWVGWEEDGELTEVALVYTEPEVPVLHALSANGPDGLQRLLEAAGAWLPDTLYAHLTSGLLDPPPAGYRVVGEPAPHRKLALAHRGEVLAHATGEVELLGPRHLDELEDLYAAAYPGTWFRARMLETGRYVGRREGGRLVAVAGVHLTSPRYGVAALGNVATHPLARGRGHARAACAHLCRLLAEDGVRTIGLNVAEGNDAALAVYRSLGFEEVGRFDEVTLTRDGSA